MALTIDSSWLQAITVIPFWRVQTLLQTQDLVPNLKWTPSKGIFDCFRKISREEGKRFLWRGGIPAFLCSMSNDFFQDLMTDVSMEIEAEVDETQEGLNGSGNIENSDRLPSSGLGNEDVNGVKTKTEIIKIENANPFASPGLPLACAVMLFGAVTHPIEVLRVRMASDYGGNNASYTGMLDAGKKLWKAGGLRALYKGYMPMTLQMIINQNALAYAFGKKEDYAIQDLAIWMLSIAATYPLEVVSSRMMMWYDNPLGKYKGMMECFSGTYKEFGFRGLYKGFQMYFVYLFGGMGLLSLLGSSKFVSIED